MTNDNFYLCRNRFLKIFLKTIDSIGYLLRKPKNRHLEHEIKKILVSRIDHLGDVLIATSIMNPLSQMFPSAKIDFLVGEWSRNLLKNNPYLNDILVYNCFRLNRKDNFIMALYKDFFSFLKNVYKLRKEKYDLAIDLRTYPFNSIPLLFSGGCKFIVGFRTGGFGFLLDTIVPYRLGIHEIEHIKDVLRELSIDLAKRDFHIKPLFFTSEKSEETACEILRDLGIQKNEKFIVIHTESGNPTKNWTKERWMKFIDRLQNVIKFKILIFSNTKFTDKYVILPLQLELEVFASILRRAYFFIGHDSFPAHLSATLGLATFVIWSGINDYKQWMPIGDKVILIRKDLSCSPCKLKKGCSSMSCMDFDDDEILEIIMQNIKMEWKYEKGINYRN